MMADPNGLFALCRIFNIFGNPIINNGLGAIGGALQIGAGIGIATLTSWTGVGAVAGSWLAMQGAWSYASSMRNLIDIARGRNPIVNNAGIISGISGAITDNETVNNIATVIDIGSNIISGGIGVTRAVSNAQRLYSTVTTQNILDNTFPSILSSPRLSFNNISSTQITIVGFSGIISTTAASAGNVCNCK
jgi:hypothetical protein